MSTIIHRLNDKINKIALLSSGLPLLLLRLYLFPVMAQAGWQKLANFNSTVEWFGNAEFGLGLPVPALMVALAAVSEFVGAWLLLFGVATRITTVPLMLTMLVAMATVHAQHGWLAIADAGSWLADGTIFTNERILAAPEKLAAAQSLLTEHGYIDWLTASGRFVILNNGIEFAATYFIMLLTLFCFGGGRFVSIDYYIGKQLE